MEEPATSIDYLKHPEKWPHLGMCPLKKEGYNFTDPNGLGLYLADYPNTVFIGNLYLWEEAQLKTAKKFKYDSLEALCADGWRVD